MCRPKLEFPKHIIGTLTISVRTRTVAVEISVRLRLHAWVLQYYARWTTGKRFEDETKPSITEAYMQNVSSSFYNILLRPIILYVTLLPAFRYHSHVYNIMRWRRRQTFNTTKTTAHEYHLLHALCFWNNLTTCKTQVPARMCQVRDSNSRQYYTDGPQ